MQTDALMLFFAQKINKMNCGHLNFDRKALLKKNTKKKSLSYSEK